MAQSFENACIALESNVREVRQSAQNVVRLLRRLEGAARSGDVAAIERLQRDLPQAASTLSDVVSSRVSSWRFDARGYVDQDAYREELEAELRNAGSAVHRAGRDYVVPPLLVRIDPRGPSIRLGRRRIRALRPKAVVAEFQRLRSRASPSVQVFLRDLYRVYRFLNSSEPRDSDRAVELERIYEAMTLAPDADYTREEFALDLVRLDSRPDLRTNDGRRLEFPASTGSRQGRRITAYTEDGRRRDFVAVRFVAET